MNNNLLKSMICDMASDGRPAQIIRLENQAGMSVVFMDIGATWLSCQVPVNGIVRDVLLGVATMADFYQQTSYMGGTVGRYANRIARGKFEIDGLFYSVSINHADNCHHGGEIGFDKRRWTIVSSSDRQVEFSLSSHDGDQGFPGNVDVSARYELTDDNQVIISFNATTNKATPVNLTNHAYFNLLGAESAFDCQDHLLQINADLYLPTDGVGIPLDKPVTVESTSFDFRVLKRIGHDYLQDQQQVCAKGYDHSFVINPHITRLNPVATVVSPDKKITMNVYTNKPAIQLYTGNWLSGTPNREGNYYHDYAGLALETQFLPDSPNHPEWDQPSCILRPEQSYLYTTTYEFNVHD